MVGSLFYVPHIVCWGSVLVFMLRLALCRFCLCNHLVEEERAGCFVLIVILMSCDC